MRAVSRVLVLGCSFGQVIALHTPSAEETDGAVLAEVDASVEDKGDTKEKNGTAQFDCNDGFANWKRGWSGAKMHWCCINDAKGCPETAADIAQRKKTAIDVAQANNKSEALAELKATIARKIAAVQQKQLAVTRLQDQVSNRTSVLQTKQSELEKLYESNSKKDTKQTAMVQASDRKEKALRMRKYGVKMQEEEIVERRKQMDVKVTEINITEKRTNDSKEDILVQKGKLTASLAEVEKATADFWSQKNASETEMKMTLKKYKDRKAAALTKKDEIGTKNAALKAKVRDLKKKEDSLSQSEWEMQDKEQAFEKKVRRMQEDKEERIALVAMQGKAVRDKEEKINSQMNLITEKRKQIETKHKLISTLEAQLAAKI